MFQMQTATIVIISIIFEAGLAQRGVDGDLLPSIGERVEHWR